MPERAKDMMVEERETVREEKTEREGLFCRKHRCVSNVGERTEATSKRERKKRETQGHAGEEIGNK